MTDPRHYFKKLAVALAAVGLGAGLTLPTAGCARSTVSGSTNANPVGTGEPTTLPSLPPLDTRAPAVFSTATFALG